MSKILQDVRSSSPLELGAFAGLLGGAVALPVLAVAVHVCVFSVALLAAVLCEWTAARRAPAYLDILRRIHLTPMVFAAMRESALLLAATVSGLFSTTTLVLTASGVVAAHTLRAAVAGLTVYVNGCRKLPLATRNVDLTRLRIPDAPSPAVAAELRRLLFEMDALIALGVLAAVAFQLPAAAPSGGAAATLWLAARAAVLLRHARANRHLDDHAWVLDTVLQEVRKSEPTVALYFTGSETSAYQVDMWLRTAERLEPSAVVLMRERILLQRMAPTSLPTVCIPDNIDLMNFELPSLQTALYPGNAGKIIHMLRVPKLTHAFIGHGDSDKPASFNPFSKVYDEIWSAGAAGRDRYRAAQIGVRDEDVREVGRPQLEAVRPAGPTPEAAVPTVLYAPTWEGWTADLEHSSLPRMGPALVKQLVDAGVRVLYKPHPLTGTRDPKALAAHRRIVKLLHEHGAGRPADAPELRRIEAELELATTPPTGADEAQRSRDWQAPADLGERIELLRAEWHRAYWAAGDPEACHVAESGSLPSLYGLFNQADALITDVSSLVSDFIASEKPYIVCNPSGIDEERFRSENPSAGAAYLLPPELDGLEKALDWIRRRREDPDCVDPLARERADLRRYLLGDPAQSAAERFALAVRAAHRRTPAPIPPEPRTPVESPRPAALAGPQAGTERLGLHRSPGSFFSP